MEIRIALWYLMASLCNPMVLNLRIPSFNEAFLRVWRCVMRYATVRRCVMRYPSHIQAVAQPGWTEEAVAPLAKSLEI